ncbi:MAG: N-succinylarginine dihydrolase [Candidatus Melainabacteria bacterium]|jgi:succinylarginine dihydrolase|nr:N-succinylarginine dihydrolase [Candidatus Melainabacteria bacterium]
MTDHMKYHELNLDGLASPTHLFSGLSHGNIASETHKGSISNPKAAALQGLAKMKYLADLGLKQAVMPAQLRPRLDILRAQGFQGDPESILKQAYEQDYELFCAVSSSSSMWTANAATISSSLEAKTLTITPANLSCKFHRSIETIETAQRLQTIFPQANHKPALDLMLSDEGAANHTRLAPSHSKPGIDLFVYGYSLENPKILAPNIFTARQALEASQTIIQNHGLDLQRTVLAQQSIKAIDAGVFHNDVISTGNLNLFLYHEYSFENQSQVIEELASKYKATTNEELVLIEVKDSEISLKQAVSSYLFNSQIVSLDDGSMLILAPIECKENKAVNQFLTKLIKVNNPISQIEYFDLRESMNNGGGPACLRLRVLVSDEELAAMNPHYLLNDELYGKLVTWVKKHYRDRLEPKDLLETGFYHGIEAAFDELESILSQQS